MRRAVGIVVAGGVGERDAHGVRARAVGERDDRLPGPETRGLRRGAAGRRLADRDVSVRDGRDLAGRLGPRDRGPVGGGGREDRRGRARRGGSLVVDRDRVGRCGREVAPGVDGPDLRDVVPSPMFEVTTGTVVGEATSEQGRLRV